MNSESPAQDIQRLKGYALRRVIQSIDRSETVLLVTLDFDATAPQRNTSNLFVIDEFLIL